MFPVPPPEIDKLWFEGEQLKWSHKKESER